MTKASIQAVAREAGVSVSTVSRTFAKPDLVLPETRDRVMTAAEKLDYSVSRSAAALKSGQSFRIALLASETITTWFNANIFAGLDSALRPSGYDTGGGVQYGVQCRVAFAKTALNAQGR